MSYLVDLITKHGAENVFFFGPASPLHVIGPIAYTNHDDPQIPYLFKIVEDRYKATDGYKVGLKPLLEGLASENFYTMDLESMIDDGRFMVLVKNTEEFNEEMIDLHGMDHVFFFTTAQPARSILGIRLPFKPSKDTHKLPMMFYVDKVENGNVQLGCPDVAIWEPKMSIKEINELSKADSFDMVLVRQLSRKESYAQKNQEADARQKAG